MKRVLTVLLLLVMAVAAMGQEPVRKYEVKSGIFKTKMTVMGQSVETTTYFDEYGALEATKAKTAVPGAGEIELTTISRDGKNYVVIPSMKQVQEQPVPESINYTALTDDVISKYKIEKVGTETVCGKECIKYTESVTEQGQSATVTVCVYKGIPMKSVTSVAGMEITSEVIELTEDAFVIAQLFEVPEY